MANLPRIKHVSHIVLFVKDPEASAAWYARVLGMRVSTRSVAGPYAGGVFMSFGSQDHDIALFPAAAGSSQGREFEHIGMEVDCNNGDLDVLRRLYGTMLREKVRIAEVLDHGVSIGIYFYDPDGHQMEVFCQLIGDGDAAIAELGRNQGKADPIELQPLYE